MVSRPDVLVILANQIRYEESFIKEGRHPYRKWL